MILFTLLMPHFVMMIYKFKRNCFINSTPLYFIWKWLNFLLITCTSYFIKYFKNFQFSPILAYWNRFLKLPIERKIFSLNGYSNHYVLAYDMYSMYYIHRPTLNINCFGVCFFVVFFFGGGGLTIGPLWPPKTFLEGVPTPNENFWVSTSRFWISLMYNRRYFEFSKQEAGT